MPDLQTASYTGGGQTIVNIGAYAVNQIASLLVVNNHTEVYTNTSTQTFTPKYGRVSNPTNYDQTHKIFSKVLQNGTTIYIEVFNVWMDVFNGSATYFDVQFLCFSVGTSYSGGQITNRSPVVAYPFDWYAGADNAGDYTLVDTATNQRYSSLYQNSSPATPMNTRFYVVDKSGMTSIGWTTTEEDRVFPEDFRLNTCVFNVGQFDQTHPVYGDIWVQYNVVPAGLVSTYNSNLSSVFTGLSGYLKPTVAWSSLPTPDTFFYLSGGSWSSLTFSRITAISTLTTLYANTDGSYPTGDINTAQSSSRGWASRIVIGRSVLDGLLVGGLSLISPDIDTVTNPFNGVNTKYVPASSLSGNVASYTACIDQPQLTLTHTALGEFENIVSVGGSSEYLIGEYTDV